jgi:hypothetical protein
LSSIIKKINYSFFLLLFLSIFFIQSGYSVFFDGLPWLNNIEVVTTCLFIPIILIFKRGLFKNFNIKVLIIFFFSIKLILIAFPKNGISFKQYLNEESLKNDNFIKTYDSFWNNNYSSIQTSDWNSKKNFPIDWDYTSISNLQNDQKIFKDIEDFNKLKLIYKIKFFLNLDSSYNFNYNTIGLQKESSLKYRKVDSPDWSFLNFNQKNFLEKGIYEFEGLLYMSGADWSLQSEIYDLNNKKIDFPYQKIFYEKKDNNYFLLKINFFQYLSFFLDFSLVFFLLYLVFENFIKKFFIYFLSIILLILTLFSNYLISFFYKDIFGSLGIVISLLLLFLYYLFDKNKQKYHSLYDFFIVIFPSFFIFFFLKFFYLLNVYTFLDPGNDWVAFENFSREIVVSGKWLEAGELVFWFRPGMRYIFAFNHILYGKTVFSVFFLDAWFLLGIVFYFIKILRLLDIDTKLSLITGLLLMVIYLGDNFRWLIGRGLQEWLAAFLLFLSIYLILKLKYSKTFKSMLIFIILISVIHSWLREEHIFIILSSIFFYNLSYSNNCIFRDIIKFIKVNYKILLIYFFFTTVGFLLLFVRNYYLGGKTGLDHPTFTHISGPYNSIIKFWVLFTGTQHWSSNFPRLYSVFLFFGLFIAILSLINTKIYKRINNFAVVISIFALYFPYVFTSNVGYPPRFSIHFLPLSIMICLLYLQSFSFNKYIEKNHIVNEK